MTEAELAAVRRSAITEAVDRLDARVLVRLTMGEDLPDPATVADMRAALLRALAGES
jgi:hypothetical protein